MIMCKIVVDKRFLVQFSFVTHQLIAINPQLGFEIPIGDLNDMTFLGIIYQSRLVREQYRFHQMDFPHRCVARFRPPHPSRPNQLNGDAHLAVI